MAGQRTAGGAANRGQLRIIAGDWRGRKLDFRGAEGLRPTPDRVRETLFNWLSPVLADARCLDLFAGSGALGLEALSRNARHCDLVEVDRASADCINEQLTLLHCERGRVHCSAALSWLQSADSEPYDIVFLDPPFGKDMLAAACTELEASELLAPHAHIYIESSSHEPTPEVPETWNLHREKKAGEVSYRLFVGPG